MFSWFRKDSWPPRPAAENPGRGHNVVVGFSNADKSWEESDDLAVSLAATLNVMGHKATVKRNWVELESGFGLLPQIVSVKPLDKAGVNTTTTIQVAHASLVPGGVFEYQHSSGTDIRDSFTKGFKHWAEYDLPVFIDAQRAKATLCMVAEMEPDRRLVFGPPVHMAQKPGAAPSEHDFCPCCLVTKNITAFDELLRDGKFHGIRLFVSRDAEGLIEADCRVNGIDRPAGAEALKRYAQSWPDRGVEYRKQYVCIQTREAAK
jgi:hypothetical protein